MTRADLLALQARVRAATGPDRELDYDNWFQIDPLSEKHKSRPDDMLLMPWSEWRALHISDPPEKVYGIPQNHDCYSASIDAALALVERALPEPLYPKLSKVEAAKWQCNLGRANKWAGVNGYGPTLPLAIIDALLSALLAQESPDE